MPGLFLLIIFLIDFDFGAIAKYYREHGNQIGDLSEIKFKYSYLVLFLTNPSNDYFQFVPFVFLLMIAFLFGHVIGSMSSFFLERIVVNKIFDYPSKNLLDNEVNSFLPWRWTRTLSICVKKAFRFCSFREFTKQFDATFRDDLVKVIKKRFGDQVQPSDYYWLCYSDMIRYRPEVARRIMNYVNLYGFARNTCMTFLVYILIRVSVFTKLFGVTPAYENWLILGVYIVFAFFLFWNYTKLFRRQAAELYIHFFTLHSKIHVESSVLQYNYSTSAPSVTYT